MGLAGGGSRDRDGAARAASAGAVRGVSGDDVRARPVPGSLSFLRVGCVEAGAGTGRLRRGARQALVDEASVRRPTTERPFAASPVTRAALDDDHGRGAVSRREGWRAKARGKREP